MTPPELSDPAADAGPSEAGPAVSHVGLQVLRKRADFLRAAKGPKRATGSFLLQARERGDGSAAARVGFTASKKIGNAVARNRAKRRLRALAHEVLAPVARPGWDYVLVARPGATVERPWEQLKADLSLALSQLHRPKRPAS